MKKNFKKSRVIVVVMTIILTTMSFVNSYAFRHFRITCTYSNGSSKSDDFSFDSDMSWSEVMAFANFYCGGVAYVYRGNYDGQVYTCADLIYNLRYTGGGVSWVSKFESKVTTYNIYKSRDGGASWTSLGTTGAIGVGDTVSTDSTNYSFYDPSQLPTDIYKIAAVSASGVEFTYIDAAYVVGQPTTANVTDLGEGRSTPTVDPSQSGNQIRSIIYPSPVHDFLTVSINSNSTEEAKISVYNLLGQTVNSKISTTKLNVIDFTSLPTGTYVIKIQLGKTSQVQTVMKE